MVDTYSWTAHAANTYGRCPNGTGAFTNTTSSTKGAANDCGPGPSPVRISEVESNGGTPGDWVELLNPSAAAVNISGYTFKDNDDTHAYVIPGGTTIPAGGRLVLEEAQFGFGLGASDSARLFDTANTLVDSFVWTAHAISTYSRCPDATGAFADTASTKGLANSCGQSTFQVWPGGTDVQTVGGLNVFGTNLSGLAYEGSGTAAKGTLWAVRNGPESLFRLIFDGAIWTPDFSNGWTAGKTLQYPNGAPARPDSEGVTFAGSSTNGIYVSVERDNNANTISRNSVLRFDPAAPGSTLVATHEWNLTADLPVTGANLGGEAIVWVPDNFLVRSKFFDASKNHLYNPSDYPAHGTGLFFIGLEANGQVYGYALDHSGSGAFTKVATILTGLTGVMDLEFDAALGNLWVACDDTCQGRTVVLRVDSTGRFAAAGGFERPAGMPNTNNEGFTIAPLSECVANQRPVYWSDDNQLLGHALRGGTLSCSQVVTFPDTLAPAAAPTKSPLANAAGWNNTDVTITWNWTDDAGGSGLDAAQCAASSNSSGEGTVPVIATCKDLAGNTGDGTATVKVDKTAPVVSVTNPVSGTYPNTATVVLTWTASDLLSGLDGQVAKLDGNSVTNGHNVNLFLEALGTHTLEVSATDKAGNSTTQQVQFTVGVTAQSLADSIDLLVAMGEIDKNMVKPLTTKTDGSANQLNALLNQLDAQRGKKISEYAFGLIQAAVEYLIAHP